MLVDRLCHIVHGPHDEHFHKLWDQLRDEYDALIRKGYTGEGFLSQGQKLGGGRIPMQEARRRARAAAEKRKILTAGSGQKLGGAPVRRGQDIRKVIADAAERRTRVTKGCSGSGISKDRERELVQETNKSGFLTKAEEDDANEEAMIIAYIDLVQEEEKEKWGDAYIPPSNENPAGSQGGPSQIKSEPGTRPEASTSRYYGQRPPVIAATKPWPPTVVPAPSKPPPSQNDTWTCDICTLVNLSTYLCCDACGTEPPSPPPQRRPNLSTTPSTQARSSSIRDSNARKAVKSLMSLDATTSKQPQQPMGWLCHTCGNFMENEWWTCGRCGTMKLSS